MYTWADIDLKALDSNLAYIRSLAGDRKVMGVVKQDAYGHGLIEVALRLQENEIDFLGVHAKEEARLLRAHGVTVPILILSNVIEGDDVRVLIRQGVRFSVRDEEFLRMLDAEAAAVGAKAIVHVKVDTGMNRLGINDEVAEDFIVGAMGYGHIIVEGLFSHLSSADSDDDYTRLQLAKFNAIVEKLKQRGITIPVKHIANSAGIVSNFDAQLDMVRAGIMMYGVSPLARSISDLKPVMSVKTRVIHVKRIPPHSFVSYSKTWETPRNTVLAVLGVGYAHGFPWALSNKGFALIAGRRHRIVGRVCMDHILADITDEPDVNIGDEAVIVGNSGNESISVVDLAGTAGTISYEILTRFRCIPKRYL
jgi:alanine racemase